jgi:hypothetical protein
MYDVADQAKGQPHIETWIAQGFWFCDTWIRAHTSHPNFPRPPGEAYQDALGLLHDLACFLFTGLNPYNDARAFLLNLRAAVRTFSFSGWGSKPQRIGVLV